MNKSNNKSQIWVILFALVVIIVAINIPLMFLASNITFEEKVDISCLEVISFAIAIWASLNIFNIFDRKDFERFKENSKKEMDIFKEDQIEITKEIHQKNKVLDEIIYEQFLQELLKTIKDVVSERFYVFLVIINSKNYHSTSC